MQTFTGFSNDTIRFLAELTLNNDKGWFDQNRARYEAVWLEPAKLFVEALGKRLKKLSPGVAFEPKINGSLLRINRDTRFTKNKEPYKTHLDLWFWEGAEKSWQSSGFYFRLTASALLLGTGVLRFEPPLLARYRKAVPANSTGEQLVKAVTAIAKKKIEIGGDNYTRVPKGFPSDHPRARWLKQGGLYAGFESKVPRDLKSSRFVDYCVDRYRATLPIHRWLVKLSD